MVPVERIENSSSKLEPLDYKHLESVMVAHV